MTDLETLSAMLDRIGATYTTTAAADPGWIELEVSVPVDCGDGKPIRGYPGFAAHFTFRVDGSLVFMSIAE